MVLHVFNPEHDLALASGLSNFTAPHAGRRLRADLGYLPALWAGDDDCVLVEHVEQARRAYGRLRARVGGAPKRFVDKTQLSRLAIDRVEPWGWDMALRATLIRYGVRPEACAGETEIAAVREYSHRRYAAEVLRLLDWEPPVEATSSETVEQCLEHSPRLVVKAPWSSSGRGIRFIDGELSDYHRGWLRNVIALSLFDTRNGAYTGNIIAHEDEKLEMISRYVPISSIDVVRAKVADALQAVLGGHYTGPFGVDMMILSKPEGHCFSIHPCVEINLRRTMGHIAIEMANASSSALAASSHFALPRVMQITLSDKYRIHILRQH